MTEDTKRGGAGKPAGPVTSADTRSAQPDAKQAPRPADKMIRPGPSSGYKTK